MFQPNDFVLTRQELQKLSPDPLDTGGTDGSATPRSPAATCCISYLYVNPAFGQEFEVKITTRDQVQNQQVAQSFLLAARALTPTDPIAVDNAQVTPPMQVAPVEEADDIALIQLIVRKASDIPPSYEVQFWFEELPTAKPIAVPRDQHVISEDSTVRPMPNFPYSCKGIEATVWAHKGAVKVRLEWPGDPEPADNSIWPSDDDDDKKYILVLKQGSQPLSRRSKSICHANLILKRLEDAHYTIQGRWWD